MYVFQALKNETLLQNETFLQGNCLTHLIPGNHVKEALLGATARDLLLFRTMPDYYRSYPGDLARELVAMDKAGASNEELGRKMGGFENLRIGMVEGDMDRGYVSVGNGITHIHEIKSAQEIINELTADWR